MQTKNIIAAVDIKEKFQPPIETVNGVGGFISTLVKNLYVLAGIVFLAMFLWGGFEIIRGAGTDDRDQVGRGKKILTSGVLGFLIIFASYWIIQIIQTITGMPILK